MMDSLTEAQNSFEQRFNCVICMCPKLRMVYGICQHRFCVDCLYESYGQRRRSLDRCPTCQMMNSFPFIRPDIPDDNIEMQKCLGMTVCEKQGCGMELWEWEVEAHKECHSHTSKSQSGNSTPDSTPKRKRSAPVKPNESERVTRSSARSYPSSRLRPRRHSNPHQ